MTIGRESSSIHIFGVILIIAGQEFGIEGRNKTLILQKLSKFGVRNCTPSSHVRLIFLKFKLDLLLAEPFHQIVFHLNDISCLACNESDDVFRGYLICSVNVNFNEKLNQLHRCKNGGHKIQLRSKDLLKVKFTYEMARCASTPHPLNILLFCVQVLIKSRFPYLDFL